MCLWSERARVQDHATVQNHAAARNHTTVQNRAIIACQAERGAPAEARATWLVSVAPAAQEIHCYAWYKQRISIMDSGELGRAGTTVLRSVRNPSAASDNSEPSFYCPECGASLTLASVPAPAKHEHEQADLGLASSAQVSSISSDFTVEWDGGGAGGHEPAQPSDQRSSTSSQEGASSAMACVELPDPTAGFAADDAPPQATHSDGFEDYQASTIEFDVSRDGESDSPVENAEQSAHAMATHGTDPGSNWETDLDRCPEPESPTLTSVTAESDSTDDEAPTMVVARDAVVAARDAVVEPPHGSPGVTQGIVPAAAMSATDGSVPSRENFFSDAPVAREATREPQGKSRRGFVVMGLAAGALSAAFLLNRAPLSSDPQSSATLQTVAPNVVEAPHPSVGAAAAIPEEPVAQETTVPAESTPAQAGILGTPPGGESARATRQQPSQTERAAAAAAVETTKPRQGGQRQARVSAAASTKPTKPTQEPSEEATKGPFNPDLAARALEAAAQSASSCRRADDPSGIAVVTVTFAPSGRVTTTTIAGPPFVGTPTGSCIASALRSASVPAFSGDLITVKKTVTIY